MRSNANLLAVQFGMMNRFFRPYHAVDRLDVRSIFDRIHDQMYSYGGYTPRPEAALGKYIRAGKVRVVRRRFKPPLIVIITKKPRRYR